MRCMAGNETALDREQVRFEIGRFLFVFALLFVCGFNVVRNVFRMFVAD